MTAFGLYSEKHNRPPLILGPFRFFQKDGKWWAQVASGEAPAVEFELVETVKMEAA